MPTEPGRHRHEQSDVNVRGIILAGVVLLVVGAIAQVMIGVQFKALLGERARENPPPSPIAAAAPEAPPEPRLQTAPEQDLTLLRAEEDAALHGYGWEDRAAGVVHIPIERAMELVAKETR